MTPRSWWQFSLIELLMLTTAIAISAAMVKVIGWGILCLLLHPAMLIVYAAVYIDRRLRRRIQRQREERSAAERLEETRP